MSIESAADLEGMRRIGRIVALTLAAMRRHVAGGMTTAELDAVAAATLERHGARPTPRHVYGFPGASCISINEEAVHGIPGQRVLRIGDVVKLDVTADKDGYVADAARTLVVGGVPGTGQRLADCAAQAFQRGLEAARAGNRTRDIGKAVQGEVRRHGFTVLPQLAGHGVGRSIHEPPTVPNYDEPRAQHRLEPGLVLTIEPIIAVGHWRVVEEGDGWTLRTADRSLSAHHEETILITEGQALVLTADERAEVET